MLRKKKKSTAKARPAARFYRDELFLLVIFLAVDT